MKRLMILLIGLSLLYIVSGCSRSPKIHLEEKDFMVEVNDEYFVLENLSAIVKASDNKGNPIPFENLKIMGEYDLSTCGSYPLTITASVENHATVENVILNVVDTSKPIFGYVDKEILVYRNTKFNADPKMNLIFAYDAYEKDVTDRIQYDQTVTTNKVGVYEVLYSVSDSSGNTNELKVNYRVTDSLIEFTRYIYQRTIDFYWGKYFIVDETYRILNYDTAVYYMFTNNGQAQFERGAGLSVNRDNTQGGITLTKELDGIYMYPQMKVMINNYLYTDFNVAYQRGIYLRYYALAYYSNNNKAAIALDSRFDLKKVDGKWYVEEFALPN